ncbi:MBOAT family O-acyltransferase [Mucilaginibacter sp.]
MNFITLSYAGFLVATFTIYWALQSKLKVQNLFILVANYVFYGWWDYRFLLLLFSFATFDYFIGIAMHKARQPQRKQLLALSITLNIGTLFICKYLNFFIDSLHTGLLSAGVNNSLHTLNIILPVGLSFFTFQTLSYSLDIYKGKIQPTTDYVVFLGFTSFFPQLLAGPIERASQLIPQLASKRVFNYEQAVDGARQITYGIFKKVVIADHLAVFVEQVFSNYQHAGSGELLKGTIFFAIQLYADFSGYSDIAIGTGKLLGFQLTTNFKTPFFARSIPESWSRWHISLTTWFRDYVFIPLVRKNKSSILWRIYCTVLLFVLIGFWHGANSTFIVFGVLHGLYFIPNILSKRITALKEVITFLKENVLFSKISIAVNFLIVALTIVLFRAPDMKVAIVYYQRMFGLHSFSVPDQETINWILILTAFFAFEWIQQDKKQLFDIRSFYPPVRVALQLSLMLVILYYGFFGMAGFIYFKF